MTDIHKNASYELVIVHAPGPHAQECYGVRNLRTQVVEAYVGQLAHAIRLADKYNKELVEGITEPASIGDFLAQLGQREPGDSDGGRGYN
jgi:hypothetical protein